MISRIDASCPSHCARFRSNWRERFLDRLSADGRGLRVAGDALRRSVSSGARVPVARGRLVRPAQALCSDGPRVRACDGKVGWLTLVGGAIGMALAVAVGKLAKVLLFEVKGHDPLVLFGAAVLLALVALLAGLVPALRASRIDPMRALRYE